MSVLFVFLDGVGLGTPTPDNPLATLALPAFEQLAGGQRWTADATPIGTPSHVFAPIDATLGLEGLPQSGTGQAALFSGENAAQIHGRHFGPYPPTTVRDTLAERSVFARLARCGMPTDRLAFANAYPDRFFEYAERRGRWTATTLAARSAGVRLRRAEDLRRDLALTADLTRSTWVRLFDPSVDVISEAEAGRQLAALLEAHDFVLFEYFLTDKAGHSRDPTRAAGVVQSLDAFASGLLGALGPQHTLVVTSDHGNIEDLSTKSHTRNPVPLIAWGPGASRFVSATSLLDVTPSIVQVLTSP
ncbi:MAG: peptidase [Bacteroidota bacterium]